MAGVEAGPAAPVVVGVDGSPGSFGALTWALHVAVQRQAPVLVVTVWSWAAPLHATATDGDPVRGSRPGHGVADSAAALQEWVIRCVVAEFEGRVPPLTTELIQGEPASQLVERSRGAQLLVVAGRGRATTVTEVCTRFAACPVVVVPAPTEPSPAELAAR